MNPTHFIEVFLAQSPSPAEAKPDFGFWYSVAHAGPTEQFVMLLLLVFSAISWAIIIYKWKNLRRAYDQSESFLDIFWSSKRLDAIYEKSEEFDGSPISQVFRAGYIELAKLKKADNKGDGNDTQLGDIENISRSMRRASASQITSLESLIPFLATCGSTAPFIGLFGTVVGIMTSFQDIGRLGNANLATVAPGIGGALVATAFGLFAAIPAVIAYNYFLTRTRVLDTEMQNFSSDFLNIVKRHFF
jgi:biopolymer transport protein TolQ